MNNDFWQQIINNDFRIPEGHTQEALTAELVSMLASPDPNKRNATAQNILTHWINGGTYTPDALRSLMKTLIKNLRADIQNPLPSDAVFLRSYSALMLAVIVGYDNHFPFLKDGEIANLLDKALDYLAFEKDLRGYEAKKGWMHSCAHTADLLLMLALNRHMRAVELAHLMYAIVDKVKKATGYVLIYGEMEHLAAAALAALAHPASSEKMRVAWFNRAAIFAELTDDLMEHFDPATYSGYYNTKNLLQTMYFQLALAEDPPPGADDLRQRLLDTLQVFPF